MVEAGCAPKVQFWGCICASMRPGKGPLSQLSFHDLGQPTYGTSLFGLELSFMFDARCSFSECLLRDVGLCSEYIVAGIAAVCILSIPALVQVLLCMNGKRIAAWVQ